LTVAQIDEPTRQKPLRPWPGVVIVLLVWLARFGVPMFLPETVFLGALGGIVGGVAIVVWWAFFSRAPRLERWGAVALMIVALAATWGLNHESMGPLWLVAYAIPILSFVFVAWAVASRRWPEGPRRAAMVATILLTCGVWTLIRTGGITGEMDSDFAWRWTESPEERLLARAGDEPAALPTVPTVEETGASWPGFRGPKRDSIVPGMRIDTDWSQSPPVELWRRPIGPGWSSFAVGGDLLYTQEQRGDDEVVSCYRVTTGDLVWRHHDTARFLESNAGPGPRATPTLSDGRVYTFGATGILNVLDAGDGAVAWSRNVASDASAKVPTWGFSSSPLVIDDVVVVAAAGQLVGYERATGDPRWFGPEGGASYSSPHLVTIDGVAQILLLSGAGTISVAAADGALLWEHPAPGAIVQPALTADGNVLTGTDSTGMSRIAVARGPGGWTAEELWASNRLKPNFNDFVVHEGHAYGFDGRILASIDLKDGQRKWKGGRYGNGQLLLLPDQDLLLVVSEKGELALVAATPERFKELARFPALEGKTWNHPVLVGNRLLIRNGQEMAAFRVSLATG
jgi:outer membrane protein assembly factor BamB